MLLSVTKKQALKNREYIVELWKKVNPKWVYLDSFFKSTHEDYRGANPETLALACDGKGGPHNECGAVACFAGWNWTEHHYQNWCRKHGLSIASTSNLSIWLGLEHDTHRYYESRQRDNVSEYREAKDRLRQLLKEDVVNFRQQAWSKEMGIQV